MKSPLTFTILSATLVLLSTQTCIAFDSNSLKSNIDIEVNTYDHSIFSNYIVGALVYDSSQLIDDERSRLNNYGIPTPALVNIQVDNKGNSNTIKWATLEEVVNDKFIIEHSISGRNFYPIGEVIGEGNSKDLIKYSFDHHNPVLGLNYYRIKQVDNKGVFTYSKTINTYNKSTAQLNAFPNPFTNLITIQTEEDQDWKLLDTNGNMVMRGKSKEIKTNHLPAGTYFLLTQAGNIDYLLKMVKQ